METDIYKVRRYAVLVSRGYYPEVLYFDTLDDARAEYEQQTEYYREQHEDDSEYTADGVPKGVISVALTEIPLIESAEFTIYNP